MPLREQIAHALFAVDQDSTPDDPVADYPEMRARYEPMADAVLPLVEAAEAAERGRAAGDRETVAKYGLRDLVDEEVCEAVTRFQSKPSVLSREQIDSVTDRLMRYFEAVVAAERLRLHTQLRYRRDAAMRNAQDVADERGSRAELGYFQTLAEAYDNAIGLLGVAATPPLADAIRDMAATVEARMAEYAATIRRLHSEQPRDEAAILKWDHRWDEARWTLATLRDVLGVAATPQPEEQ